MEINNSTKETYKYKGKELCMKNDGYMRRIKTELNKSRITYNGGGSGYYRTHCAGRVWFWCWKNDERVVTHLTITPM